MKVVFPCKGSLVILKQDLETLQSFYNTKLITSKLYETYKQSNIMVQVGKFNYIPTKSSIVLYKANVLTIEKMRKILGLYNEQAQKNASSNEQPKNNPEISEETDSNPIKDDDIMSNPFFKTLTLL